MRAMPVGERLHGRRVEARVTRARIRGHPRRLGADHHVHARRRLGTRDPHHQEHRQHDERLALQPAGVRQAVRAIAIVADSPERTALYRKMSELALAYAPLVLGIYRYENVVAYPWVLGLKRNAFMPHPWKYLDVDVAKRNGVTP